MPGRSRAHLARWSSAPRIQVAFTGIKGRFRLVNFPESMVAASRMSVSAADRACRQRGVSLSEVAGLRRPQRARRSWLPSRRGSRRRLRLAVWMSTGSESSLCSLHDGLQPGHRIRRLDSGVWNGQTAETAAGALSKMANKRPRGEASRCRWACSLGIPPVVDAAQYSSTRSFLLKSVGRTCVRHVGVFVSRSTPVAWIPSR